MRILFVGMADGSHTAHWINQIADLGWDIHLLSSRWEHKHTQVHPELRNVNFHPTFYVKETNHHPSVKFRGLRIYAPTFPAELHRAVKRWVDRYSRPRLKFLRYLIWRLRPDVIHSLEFESAGYLTLEARQVTHRYFPPWVAGDLLNELYLYRHVQAYSQKIRAVLTHCDYFLCESQRDGVLAVEMGLCGKVSPVLLAAGGFDLKTLEAHRNAKLPSKRRLILLNGQEDVRGRALFGLRALRLCTELIRGYEIVVYEADEQVSIAAELMAQATGLKITVTGTIAEDDLIALFARARVHISLSISEATSRSFLWAIATGVFPIQSVDSCADEWIIDGKGGLIVPAEEINVIARALQQALTDDRLVDAAAQHSRKLVAEKLDFCYIQSQIIDFYQTVAASKYNLSARL
jgi:glycosyltransferase involved in cell wall biosynthesis